MSKPNLWLWGGLAVGAIVLLSRNAMPAQPMTAQDLATQLDAVKAQIRDAVDSGASLNTINTLRNRMDLLRRNYQQARPGWSDWRDA